MKIDVNDEAILGNGGKKKKFSIAAGAKAFKILSSTLYKNKIRAIIRELACNCTDAHFLNGFDGAFDIKVPTQLDPRFVIRDYGPGLNPDDIENLYTTYFGSTKGGSNDFIGAFGLGSKSPFSYTQTFTITSYHKGVVSGYTAMLDNGEPVIMPLFSSPMEADEKEGIEIVVPVKVDDLSRWREEIEYTLRPFGKDKVNIQGAILDIQFFDKFDEYDVTPYKHGDAERSGLWAVYGNIVYPIKDIPGLRNTWLEARYGRAYIRFPLGELDITPSREELSLDETTVENIISRIHALDKRVMDEDTIQWKTGTNARQIYRELKGLNSAASKMVTNVGARFSSLDMTMTDMYKAYIPDENYMSAGVVYDVCVDPRLRRIKKRTTTASVNFASYFGVDKKSITIVIDDRKGRLPMIRALNHIHHSEKPEYKKILADNKWLPKQFEELLFVDPESFIQMSFIDKIKGLFCEDKVNVLRTSDIYAVVEPAMIKNVRGSSGYVPRPKAATATEYKYDSINGGWAMEEQWIAAAEADEITGKVVFINGNNFLAMSGPYAFNLTRAGMLELAHLMGINKVTFVRPTLQKKIIKLEQCECLLHEIYDKFVELIDAVDYTLYSAVGGTAYNYTRHTNQYPELGFLAHHFNASGTTTPESELLSVFAKYLKNVFFDDKENELTQRATLSSQIVKKLQAYAETVANDKVAKFENENLVVSEYMRSRYDLKPAAIKEIVKLMGR